MTAPGSRAPVGTAPTTADAIDGAPPSSGSISVDVALVGVGGAGLTMLHELARRPRHPDGRPWRVALSDDVDRLTTPQQDRTWCFWATGSNPADPALSSTTRVVRVLDSRGAVTVDLSPFSYRMLRSADYHRLVAQAVDRAGLELVRLSAADVVADGEQHAQVLAAGTTVVADRVFDSRPRRPGPARTLLWQHFLGAFVPIDGRHEHADLMDFRVAQPEEGFAFGYLIPAGPASDPRQLVLAEYTVVSRRLLPAGEYRRRLTDYLDRVVGPGRWGAPEHLESGVIPMTDAAPPRPGHRVIPTGTAGGATRGSTGYTFRAMQRQAAAHVEDLVRGHPPRPHDPVRPRQRWLDAVMLRAVDTGRLDAARFFVDLFRDNPGPRLLTVLDGTSTLAQDARFVGSAPVRPMLTSAVDRGRRRPPGTDHEFAARAKALRSNATG